MWIGSKMSEVEKNHSIAKNTLYLDFLSDIFFVDM